MGNLRAVWMMRMMRMMKMMCFAPIDVVEISPALVLLPPTTMESYRVKVRTTNAATDAGALVLLAEGRRFEYYAAVGKRH